MTAVAVAVAAVVLGVSLALWDGLRRALASQVRLAELRVEGQRRADVVEVDARCDALAAELERLRRDHDGLERGLAIGRRR